MPPKMNEELTNAMKCGKEVLSQKKETKSKSIKYFKEMIYK